MTVMAEKCNIHRETISFWLERHNFPIRSLGESIRLGWQKKKFNIAKEELKEKYIDEKMTMRECAKYFNCSTKTILNRFREYNIESRNTSEANKGRKVWNKGKKGLQTSWLKGTKGLRSANKGSFRKGQYSGSKHPMWKGGISSEPYPFNFNKELKELIRKRDNYQCQLCGMPECENIKKLDIHHIDYDKKNLNPKNLISLCRNCHMKTNYNREYWEGELECV